jgi:CRISPR-associated protein Csx17
VTATTNTARTHHVLAGLRPEPLASYLAGLGLIRVLGEQADLNTTAAWTTDGLALTTSVTGIAAWLADEYVPTPVLSPWNNGSGFGLKDKGPRRVLSVLREHPSPRLAHFRDAIRLGEEVVRKARDKGWISDSAGGGEKARVVQEFRNRCPETLLPWVDATVVLTGEDTFFPPLLGTGGNDGRLDFSTNFHQRLLDVIGTSSRARALALAEDMLVGTETEQLTSAAVGQFDPARAGGPGSSRFGAASSLVNPWEYILLVEGALLFAASAVRRNQHYRLRDEQRAAIPFTVDASPYGSASGAAGEETRGEVWVPVWAQQFTLPEVKQLFGEARASWRGRPARRAVDFYSATHTLGVARGISEFTRYGLQRRNGLAFAAVPLDRIHVQEKEEVRLAADVTEWVSWVRAGDASAAIVEAVRRFDSAHLAYARDGGSMPLARMLAALTALEQAVGRSGRAKESTPVRRPPPAQKFLDVLTAGDSSAELRIAVGLASCAALSVPGPGREPPRAMRQILLPIDPRRPDESARGNGHWRDSAIVPGFGVRPLPEVLADVLIWWSRTVTAGQDQQRAGGELNIPAPGGAGDQSPGSTQQRVRGVTALYSRIPVPAADLHALASRAVDVESLDRWLRACLALDWSGVQKQWPVKDPLIPVPTLGLLHPLALGLTPAEARKTARANVTASGVGADLADSGEEPRLALRPDWAARLAAGQVRAVHDEAVARLRQVGWNAVPTPPEDALTGGVLIAAALVPRCLKPWRLLGKLASPIDQPGEQATSPSTEPADLEEQA